MPAALYLYPDDVEITCLRDLSTGATKIRAAATQVYGDQDAGVPDASGNGRWKKKREENVSTEELLRRLTIRRGSPLPD